MKFCLKDLKMITLEGINWVPRQFYMEQRLRNFLYVACIPSEGKGLVFGVLLRERALLL